MRSGGELLGGGSVSNDLAVLNLVRVEELDRLVGSFASRSHHSAKGGAHTVCPVEFCTSRDNQRGQRGVRGCTSRRKETENEPESSIPPQMMPGAISRVLLVIQSSALRMSRPEKEGSISQSDGNDGKDGKRTSHVLERLHHADAGQALHAKPAHRSVVSRKGAGNWRRHRLRIWGGRGK